jgi:hypothetical protein
MRHQVLQHGGIKNTGHDVYIRFIGEGKRPDTLPPAWEWIDWSHTRVADRHIKLIAEGMLDEDSDLVVFCDDDSLTDVDHMVSCLRHGIDNPKPHLWTAWPGKHFPESWVSEFKKHAGSFVGGRDLCEMWLGYEISVMNKSLVKRINGSDESKAIYRFSPFLNQDTVGIPTPCDLQASMLAWLVGANHINGSQCNCQQWPNFLDYHGFHDQGRLWHIHWTDTAWNVSLQDVLRTVKKAPFNTHDDMIDCLFSKLFKGFKARDYIEKPMQQGVFLAYWHAGRHHPFKLLERPKFSIVSDKSVRIISNPPAGTVAPAFWKSIPDGMEIDWGNGYKNRYQWKLGDVIVGYEIPKLGEPYGFIDALIQ